MALSGKIAIITGSNQGFGSEIARVMARDGATVVVTYWDEEGAVGRMKAEQVAEEVNSDLIVAFDVRERGSVKALMKRVHDMYGRIDILVNNAGINIVGDFDKITEQQWNAVLAVDLKGVFICCQEVLSYMPSGGRIINIGSVSGEYGGPRTPSYAAAKAGVMALTHCAARFLGPRGITVNCVSPGMIRSEMLDDTMPPALQQQTFQHILLQRLGTSNEVAETVAFLASEGAGYITAQTIDVNGGLWV